MSEPDAEQLADLKRSRDQWDDDPDNHGPYPLLPLIETLEAALVGRGGRDREGRGRGTESGE